MATAGTLEYLISINSSQVNSGLGNAESKVKSFGDKMSKWAVAKGQIIGRLAEKAGAATLQFVKGSVQESMGFDKTMSQVAATLGKTTGEVQDLAKFARQMGAETAFTAQEAAEGLNYMALAGYDATKSMKMLPLVLNLAAAGNMDLAAAADMVTDAESALSLTTGETEAMIDQMAKTASKTNTSVEQLGEAILTVGGTAKNLAGGTKELNMVLGVLADNGIKGSEGGTALRNMILSLSAPTDKAAKRFKQLNIDIFDAEGNMRAMPDIMQDLNTAMAGMSQKERTAVLSDIFNKRDLKAAEALLGTDAKRWSELGYEIGNSAGAAKQMADTQLDNLQGDVTKLKSAFGEAKLTLVEKLTPSLRVFAKSGTKLIQRLTDAFKERGLKGAMQEAWKILKDFGKNLKVRAKAKLTSWLDLGEDASWSDIGRGLIEKLKTAISDKKIKIAQLLHIPNPEDASWGDIAQNISTRLTNALGQGGEFIKKLILGDGYSEESTWQDVGTKLSEWIGKGFEDGGWISNLLSSAGDKVAAIATFAGNFITELANWIGDHTDEVVGIIKKIVEAIAKAAAPIAEALVKVISDPAFQAAIGKLGMAIFEAIFGKDAADNLRQLFAKFGIGGSSGEGSGDGSGSSGSGESEQSTSTFEEGLEKDISDAFKSFELGNKLRTDVKNAGFDTFWGFVPRAWKDKLGGLFDAYGIPESARGRLYAKYDFGNLSKQLTSWKPEEMGDFMSVLKQNLIADMQSAIQDAANSWAAEPDSDVPVDIDLTIPEGAAEEIAGEVGTVILPAKLSFAGAMKPDGFFTAKGNWDVPYDNYPALLHRGEMVLNKSQARQFRDGEGGGSYDMSSLVNNAISSAMSKVYVMLNGDKVGDLTSRRIGRNINATTFNKLRALGG